MASTTEVSAKGCLGKVVTPTRHQGQGSRGNQNSQPKKRRMKALDASVHLPNNRGRELAAHEMQ
eukprot:540133-Amphidinium_carterae.1